MATEVADYVLAPESGLFEAVVDLGDTVAAGDLVGRMHFLERPDRPATEILAETADSPRDDYDRVMGLNVHAAFAICRARSDP